MNKKMISLLLALLLMLVPAAIAQAEEATETVNIEVGMVVYTFNVQVDTTITTGLTLKMVPLTEDLNSDPVTYTEGAPVYLDECLAYEPSPINATLNRYIFDAFDVLPTTDSGKYRIYINGTYTKDIDFVNKNDKVAFYRALTAATVDQWEAELANGVASGVVDFPLGGYFDYDDDIQREINKCLYGLGLELNEEPSDAEITAFEELLKPEIARLLNVAEFATAPTKEAFVSAVNVNKVSLGLDLKYYDDETNDEETDEDVRLAPELIQECFETLTYSYETEEVKKAFDLASLLATIKTSGEEVVTEALSYYDGGCINLNTSLTTGFTATDKNKISQKMKLANATNAFTSATDIETAFETAAVAVQGEKNTPGNTTEGFDSPLPGPSTPITGVTGGPGGTTTPTTPSKTPEFSDLGEAAWAKTAIEALTEKGVLAGKGDGKFYPNDTVTREEYVKIIVEAIDIHEKHAKVTFNDVASSRWSYSYIASAYRANIIQGTSGTEFSPAGEMSRQDMAVIMKRVADLLGIKLKGSNTKFADDASIAGYAKDAVKALSGAGIINGTGNNTFSPKATVTRAQAAKVVYELLVYGGMI